MVFGILKCLFHLARVELKALLFTALATAIYVGIVFTGNTVCDKMKEYHKSEQFQTKTHEKKLYRINDMIATEPNNDMLFLERGRLRKSYKQNEKAIEDFETALDMNPQNNQALVEMINYYRTIQDYEKELEMLEHAFANTSNKFFKSRIDDVKKQINATKNEQNE